MNRRARPVPAGAQYGALTVIQDRQGSEPVLVRCVCGTEKRVAVGNLSSTFSCGCQQKARARANFPRFVEVAAGTRFGRLTVTRDRQRGDKKLPCVCDCGQPREVEVHALRTGNTTSCGCSRRADPDKPPRKLGRARVQHGMTGTPAHQSWRGMLERCLNANSKQYKRYGGRGITICERWRTSFVAFHEDMGDRPEGMTLERIDNDGNYEPGNCRWATQYEQVHNRRPIELSETCGKGHFYGPDPWTSSDGGRRCRECDRLAAAARRARKRSTRGAA